jgi:lysozyme
MNNTLIERIIKHEALKLKPYRCSAGKLTIGVGRNLDDNGITEEEAHYLLKNDIRNCHSECLNNLPFYAEMDSVRQGVILEMCFNLGINRLKGFKNMLKACELKNYALASQEMLNSRWALQVGQRARTLAQIMKMGVECE